MADFVHSGHTLIFASAAAKAMADKPKFLIHAVFIYIRVCK
jgi:hypothetical protein